MLLAFDRAWGGTSKEGGGVRWGGGHVQLWREFASRVNTHHRGSASLHHHHTWQVSHPCITCSLGTAQPCSQPHSRTCRYILPMGQPPYPLRRTPHATLTLALTPTHRPTPSPPPHTHSHTTHPPTFRVLDQGDVPRTPRVILQLLHHPRGSRPPLKVHQPQLLAVSSAAAVAAGDAAGGVAPAVVFFAAGEGAHGVPLPDACATHVPCKEFKAGRLKVVSACEADAGLTCAPDGDTEALTWAGGLPEFEAWGGEDPGDTSTERGRAQHACFASEGLSSGWWRIWVCGRGQA